MFHQGIDNTLIPFWLTPHADPLSGVLSEAGVKSIVLKGVISTRGGGLKSGKRVVQNTLKQLVQKLLQELP